LEFFTEKAESTVS